jgi:aspartate/methionine/tyrosine aminotransferase
MQKVKGLTVIPAQGTIYIAAEIDFSLLEDIHNDREFVKLLRQEENVNVLPLSVMGQSLQGLRLLTCAKE